MEFKIPLFELNYGPEETAAVVRTLESRWISMGPAVQELERRFGEHLDGCDAVALNSCTAALHLALRALDIGPGDEVIVPSLTFVATVNAVRYVGATPVFADVAGLDDLGLDPADVRRQITPRTKAVVVMHYGGFAVDMGAIGALAGEHGLAVVEDAAHAPAAAWNGRPLGTIGDAGCFSFFANKNITCAEGGMLVSRDPEVAARARLLRAHGMTTMSFERAKGHATAYDVLELGYNYRLDDIRGALMLAQLDRLAEDIRRRSAVRRSYEDGLADLEGVVVPYRGFAHESSHYIMPVVLREGGAEYRDAVRQRMAERGVQTSVHYPAVHRFSIYEPYRRTLPLTEHVADHELTLPMYPALTPEQVTYVCDALRGAL